MVTLIFILMIMALLFQLFVVFNGYKLYKIVKPLRCWTMAWGLFSLSMMIVVVRRLLAFIDFIYDVLVCEQMTGLGMRFTEIFIEIIISGLWVIFVWKLKKLFANYLNGGNISIPEEGKSGCSRKGGENS